MRHPVATATILFLLATAATAAAAAPAATATPAAPAAAPAAFVLALEGPVAAPHTPYLHAAASGAFASAGVNVTVRYPEGRGEALAMLSRGAADACVADAVTVLAARAGGAKVTIVASVGDRHPACLVSREAAPISSPASLPGKRVAVDPLGVDRLLFPFFLAGAGLRLEDVELVPLDGALRRAALAAGTVDATVDRIGDVPGATAVLAWAEHGFALYGPCLVVRDEVLRERPAAVRAFLKAALGAWEACLREPAAAAASAARSGLVAAEAAAAWLASIKPLFDTETYRTKGLGWIDRSRMAATLEVVRGTVGQPVTFAPAEAFSTAYLPVPAVLRKADEAVEPATGEVPLKR